MDILIGFGIVFVVVIGYALTQPDMSKNRTGGWAVIVEFWAIISWIIFPLIGGWLAKLFLGWGIL